MAARPRGPGKPFPKGQSGNPSGSSARARDLRAIAALTTAELDQIGAFLLKGTRDDLKEIHRDPTASIILVWTASLIVASMQKGDPSFWKALLERLIGRCKETVMHTGPDGGPIKTETERVVMTYQDKLDRLEALRRQREAVGK